MIFSSKEGHIALREIEENVIRGLNCHNHVVATGGSAVYSHAAMKHLKSDGTEEVRRYWLTESEDALRVAGLLLEKGDYSYALFFGHLAIEKILKSLYVFEHMEHAPPLHNLVRLAKEAGLEPDEHRIGALIV